MNTAELSNLIYEKGRRGALKHCIENGEHRKGRAYRAGRYVGSALIAGAIALLLAGLGYCIVCITGGV